jgi:hypothetical protein
MESIMREVFDAGGYDSHWNPMVATFKELVALPGAGSEVFQFLNFLMTDPDACIPLACSGELRHHAKRLATMCELHAGNVLAWNQVKDDILRIDWNVRVSTQTYPFSQHKGWSVLQQIASIGAALATGRSLSKACTSIGQMTLDAAGLQRDYIMGTFEMPPVPSAPLYDDRIAEQAAFQEAERRRETFAERVRDNALDRMRAKLNILLSQAKARQPAPSRRRWRGFLMD